jgi:hypothetical protein
MGVMTRSYPEFEPGEPCANEVQLEYFERGRRVSNSVVNDAGRNRFLKLFVYLSFFFFLPLFTGCGYQFGQGSLPHCYQTVSVPYVEGDEFGQFTACLIKEVSRSGALTYCSEGGDLILKVFLCDCYEDNIGFRYDRKKERDEKERLRKSIIPVEARATLVAEVTVVDATSGCTVLGPAKILGSVDFDHDYYYSRHGINTFSLGQLTEVESARDDVKRPLYVVLAKKITEFLVNSW